MITLKLSFTIYRKSINLVNMNLLNKYFKDLIFTKVDNKEDFVVYAAGVSGAFGGGHQRYVILFVPNHLAIKSQARIFELAWQNLQTRNLTYSYRLKKQNFVIPNDLEDILLEVSKREKMYSTYQSVTGDFPFDVLLLHNSKKKSVYQYNNKITLSAALETFESVFNYVGGVASMSYVKLPNQNTLPQPINQQEDVWTLPSFSGVGFPSKPSSREIYTSIVPPSNPHPSNPQTFNPHPSNPQTFNPQTFNPHPSNPHPSNPHPSDNDKGIWRQKDNLEVDDSFEFV